LRCSAQLGPFQFGCEKGFAAVHNSIFLHNVFLLELSHAFIDAVVMLCATCQTWARIRAGSGLKPILAGSRLDRTAIFWKLADQDWIGLRKFLLF